MQDEGLAVITVSAGIHPSTIRDFTAACNRYKDELGNTQAVAFRRGLIHLIKSLRHATPQAKKQIPAAHVRRATPDETVCYITPKGKKKPLPRWAIIRRGGKVVYYKPSNPKQGDAPVKTKGEARRKWGQIRRWGLAKKSWGWFMQSLFNRANPEGRNPNAKLDKRMVGGYYREYITGDNKRVEAELVNSLNYITDILPDSAVEGAMLSAIKSINAQFEGGHAKARKELT